MTEPTLDTMPAATGQILAEKIRTKRARVWNCGVGIRGTAAGGGVRQGRLHGHRHRYQRREDAQRVNAGDSYVGDIPSATLAPLVESGKLRATTDFSAVLELDTINICVPTPLRKTKDPDMSFIVSSCAGDRALFPCRACW